MIMADYSKKMDIFKLFRGNAFTIEKTAD